MIASRGISALPFFCLVLGKLDGRDTLRVENLRFGFLDVDPADGSVWIGLPNENEMVKLNSEGGLLFRVSGFEAPWSVAVDPNDGSVWVADGGGSGRKLVKLGKTGDVLLSEPVPGGFFSNTPQQISVDPRDSSVWYTNRGGSTVVKLSSMGTPMATATGVNNPVAVSVDPQDGSIWTVSFSAREVIKFDATATELKRLKFDIVPLSVSVHPYDGTLWVGYSNNVLVQLSTEGEEITRFQLRTDEETTTVNHIVTKEIGV
uniref:SMP-30/Gluconolactonase/LRE-like region domain-containing protein n=1 Tax=Odontella aurita TaxID=265563 RepID=A0A7S4I838_9STRA|mmetsp:Transcript_21265/g.61896  ORF Transcript_21265/g.61896 Transcript_21265/m.61896 type:complete len:260 (+) Transcript_21265:322-1101(+)